MSSLFALIYVTLFICLIVGLIKPDVFGKLFGKYNKRTTIGLVFGMGTLIFILATGATNPNIEITKIEPTEQKSSIKEELEPQVADEKLTESKEVTEEKEETPMEEFQLIFSYEIKDVKASERVFSASIYAQNVNKEDVIKTVKEIKDSNYTAQHIIFELFFFSNENIADKYLRASSEESAAYDGEMKAWYYVSNYASGSSDKSLEILGEYIKTDSVGL